MKQTAADAVKPAKIICSSDAPIRNSDTYLISLQRRQKG